jgi:ABC-type Fe3+-hydroxamate transport system substrate-binding protein
VQQHLAASVRCQQVVDDLGFKRVRSDLEILPGVQIDPFKLKSGNRQVIFVLIGARSHVQKHWSQSGTLRNAICSPLDVKMSV